MVILNAVTQYQVLSTSGRTDWISLNKVESVESTFQCRGLEKTAGDGKAAQIVQRNQHDSKLAKVFCSQKRRSPFNNTYILVTRFHSRGLTCRKNWPGAILPSEARAVNAQRVEARKYPRVQPSHICDKG